MPSKIHLPILGIRFGALAPTGSSQSYFHAFSGFITSVGSFNSNISDADLISLFGGMPVSYSFEVDFNRDTYSATNSAATWNYFYADQIEEGLVHSVLEGLPISSSPAFNANFTSCHNIGRLAGGSGVRITAGSFTTDDWAVDDWVIGQSIRFTDGTSPPGGGGAVYVYGTVALDSITAIPGPSGYGVITASFMALLVAKRRGISR